MEQDHFTPLSFFFGGTRFSPGVLYLTKSIKSVEYTPPLWKPDTGRGKQLCTRINMISNLERKYFFCNLHFLMFSYQILSRLGWY